MIRKFKWIAIAILLLTALACNALAGGSTPDSASTATAGSGDSRTASLLELKNTVQARPSAAAEWGAASEGQQLLAGGGVKTGEEARARINISDGAIVRLAAQSEFALVELSLQATDPVTTFSLAAGKMWIAVTSALGAGSFEVETPVGSASVRGSYMSVQFEPNRGQMIASCLEGRCRLTGVSGKFTDLSTGEQSGIPQYGADPSPAKPVDIVQVQDWTAEFPEAAHFVATITPGPEPTATPADTPAPGGGNSGGGGQTACDHPFLPMRPGSTWTYNTSYGYGPVTWTIQSVEGDTTSATAEMVADFAGGQVTYHWQCNANGLTSYDFGTINSAEAGVVLKFEVSNASGTFLPPADLLTPGYAWSSAYTTTAEVTVEGGQTATSVNQVTESYTVAGTDSVTFGGEPLNGLQISGTTSSTIQMTMPGVSIPAISSSGSLTTVMAQGVGIVSQTSVTDGQTGTQELVSYNIP